MSLDLLLINVNPELYNYEYFLQEDVCRFCWKREAFTKIIKITTDRTFKNDLMGKITECLEIDISSCPHPKSLCDECTMQINKFHKFKQFCQDTDRKLREIFERREKIYNNANDSVKRENDCLDSSEGNVEDFLDTLKESDSETDIKTERKIKWKYKPKRTATYCNICRLECENIDKFITHNSKYHGIEKGGVYKCFGCDKLFKNRKTRLGHENNFCKGLKDGYKCIMCNRYLPRRGMYEAHMRDHRTNIAVQLPDDIFKCKKCNMLFKTKQLLKEHVFEHKTDRKNYVCESCGRVFTRKDYLHKHKLTHTGEKQHECPHCGFRTTQRSSLTVHMRRHTGERPYRCSICPQRCISSSNLRAHQQRHLGIKMHECKICNKKFGYKVSLQEHMSTHAPAQTHACEQCAASYSRLRALKRHIAAKHGPKQND